MSAGPELLAALKRGWELEASEAKRRKHRAKTRWGEKHPDELIERIAALYAAAPRRHGAIAHVSHLLALDDCPNPHTGKPWTHAAIRSVLMAEGIYEGKVKSGPRSRLHVSQNPLEALRALGALRHWTDNAEASLVASAYLDHGLGWQRIANALGTPKRTLFDRYRSTIPAQPDRWRGPTLGKEAS